MEVADRNVLQRDDIDGIDHDLHIAADLLARA